MEKKLQSVYFYIVQSKMALCEFHFVELMSGFLRDALIAPLSYFKSSLCYIRMPLVSLKRYHRVFCANAPLVSCANAPLIICVIEKYI